MVFERERNIRLNQALRERAKAFAPVAPVNQIGHMRTLATADDIMPYAPNNDTVYSGAVVQVDDEPIILSVPAIHDRYWSVEIADNFTSNLGYIGTRATGGKAGHHAFVGPGWKGHLPEGVTEFRVPSNGVMLAIRIAVAPEDTADLDRVLALQPRFQLTSLSNWQVGRMGLADIPRKYTEGRPTPPSSYVGVNGLRIVNQFYTGEAGYFQTLAALLIEDPLPAEHDAAIELLKRLGIQPGHTLDPDTLSDVQTKAMARATRDGAAILEWKKKFRGTRSSTHWNNLFPGTYGTNYLDRALGAVEGLFVHDRAEAVYFSTYEDADGNLFDGKNRYVMHFRKDQLPRLEKSGFWSITMYRADGRNLQKNPINRYAIGDRTSGLMYNEDGSLDIYVQAEPPHGKEANWLPSPPEGNFRLNFRNYLPSAEMQDPAQMDRFTPGVRKAP
jgi:hypothetical protein